MSDYSKKLKAEKALTLANAPPCKCESCKTGKIHLQNIHERNTKVINFTELKRRETELGAHCFACMHNGISGAKAWAMKKLRDSFQSLDFYEPVDGVKDADINNR